MNKETDKTKTSQEEAEETNLLPVVRGEKSLVRLDPLAAYLQEIRQYQGLSEEEEHALAVKYKETGDLKAAYRLDPTRHAQALRQTAP